MVDLPPITSETLVAVAIAQLRDDVERLRAQPTRVTLSPEEQQALAAARTGKGGS